MKNRFWIYTFVIVVIGLLFWFRPKHSVLITTPKPENAQSANQPLLNHTNIIPLKVSPLQQPINPSLNQQKLSVARLDPMEAVKRFVNDKNVPIEFYGKVVDQDSNVVSDVKVNIGIRHWTLMSDPTIPYPNSKQIELEQTSDTSGRFEFSGVTGDGFGVILTKDGYSSPPNARYGFGPKAGTFENPVIFKMWKEGEKAQLIGGSHVFGIDSGKIYTLNLMTGKKIEGEAEGDLRVTITRPAAAKPRDKFAWSFSIEAMQGGFAAPDPNDEFMYIAPKSGYQSKIKMQFDPDNAGWTGVVRKQLFITSRNGQIYGRATIEVDSIYNVHSAIQIDYAINPNGSRNLQP